MDGLIGKGVDSVCLTSLGWWEGLDKERMGVVEEQYKNPLVFDKSLLCFKLM